MSLSTNIKDGAFELSLVQRQENCAIYRKTDQGRDRGYEVIRIQIRKAESTTVNGKVYSYPDREVYPTNEQWGTHGFSCPTLQGAVKRLQSLIVARLKENGEADRVEDLKPVTASANPSLEGFVSQKLTSL